MMLTVDELITKLERVGNIKHSAEQVDILKSKGGIVILAGAGSGKTSTITELLYKKIYFGEINPDKLLCTTYSKSGSLEMEDRFNKLCEKMGSSFKVKVKTLHACYYQILKDLGYKLNICSEAQARVFIKQALNNCEILDNKDDDLIEYTANMISYQINRAIVNTKDLEQSYLFDRSKLSTQQFDAVRMEFSRLKREADVVDFDDLQWQVYYLLSLEKYRDYIIQYCRSNWEYFFIDEFQDTSRIQYEILKCMLPSSESDKLVVIGDDDQSIYQWRGTDPNIILEDVRIDYNLQTLMLPINYRCKSNIVDFASKSVRFLAKRQDKQLTAFQSGGEVEIHLSKTGYSLFEMSRQTKEYISDLIYNKGARADQIAVLCRNNNQVAILANMLMREGIYTEGAEGMKISKVQLYNDFKSAFEIYNDTTDYQLVKKYLWKCVAFLGVNGAKLVSDIMNETGISLSRAIGFLLKSFSYYGESIPDSYGEIKIAEKIILNARYRYKKLTQQADANLFALFCLIIDPKKTDKDKINTLLAMILSSVDYLYKTPERARILRGFKEYFSSLVNEMSISDVLALLKLTEQIDSGTSALLGSMVHLSTLHGAKGMEWKYVIMFCCDGYALPGMNDIGKLLDSGYTRNDISVSIDCERRLYYVGCTRAKEKLLIVGDSNNPSPFVLESLQLAGIDNDGSIKLGRVLNEEIINSVENSTWNCKQTVERYIETVKGGAEQ